MPCDTIQNSTVEFNLEKTDLALLKSALEDVGYSVSERNKTLTATRGWNGERVVFQDGKVTAQFSSRATSEQAVVSEIKRAYSTQVVKSQAKKFGWTLKEKAPGQFVVSKRR